MTIDWFVVLAPLVLLIVAMPFLFVGCASFKAAPGETTTPPPSSTPPRKTTFRFEVDALLQDQLGPQQRVAKIEVFFRIQDSLAAVGAIERPQPHLLIPQVPAASPAAIDPLTVHVAPVEVPNTDIGNRDQVICNCTVTRVNGNTQNLQPTKAVSIEPGLTYEFRLKSKKPQDGFLVYFNGVGS